jgi:hypothetical protein
MNHKLIIMQQKNLVAQKVQARAQYETLEQQRKGRLANAAVSGISDLMKSKKSDQLTKQFNDAASLKSKWNNEYKVRYAVAAGETDKVKQIEFIQLNKFDPDELDKQMMGQDPISSIRNNQKRSSEAFFVLIMYYNK